MAVKDGAGSLLGMFPLLIMGAPNVISFSGAFLRELDLEPLMTLSRFDLTVLMAPGMVTCDHTSAR